MEQRGISTEEIERTLEAGWEASDARSGTRGKIWVFDYRKEWQERFYDEKEVRVYFKGDDEHIIILTAVARYGSGFARRSDDEDRV
jgi:hypothetical protein